MTQEDEILELLSTRKSATTTDIAKALNISRTTVIQYLKKLQITHKIGFNEVGPSRLWFLLSPNAEKEEMPKIIQVLKGSLSSTESAFSPATARKLREAVASMENEARLREIKSKIEHNLVKAMNCRKMLEILETDLFLRDHHFSMIYAIDYHDLCRYLHPALDDTQTDWDVYSTEQTALHYAFGVRDYQFVLLPPYAIEFILHMRRVREDYELLSSARQPGEFLNRLRQMTRFTEEALKELVTSNVINEADVNVVKRCYNSLKEMAHLLDEGELKKHLVEAVKLLGILHESSKIVSINELRDVDPTPITIQTYDRDYLDLMIRLGKARPDRPDRPRYINNHTDAVAALTAKRFSEQNLKNNKYMVILSSTKSIREQLLTVGLEIQVEGRQCSIPILRDLGYVLLSFYFGGKEPSSVVPELHKFQRKLDVYISLLQELESAERSGAYSARLIEYAEELHQELEESLWDLASIVDICQAMPNFGRIETTESMKENLAKVNESIDALTRNPVELSNRIGGVLSTLDDAIKSLDNIFSKIVTGKQVEDSERIVREMSR